MPEAQKRLASDPPGADRNPPAAFREEPEIRLTDGQDGEVLLFDMAE